MGADCRAAACLIPAAIALLLCADAAMAIEPPPPVAATAQTIGITNSPDRALGPYIGLGHLKGTLESSNPVIGRQSANGFIFYAGFPMGRWVAFETTVGTLSGLQTGETSDRYYPPSTAEYSFVGFGLKFNLAQDRLHPIVPWLQIGTSAEMITWNEYWYNVSGSGSYIALGLDWYPAPRHSLRVEYRSHSFTGESDASYSDSYPVDVEMIGISYAFHFRGYGWGR